MVVAHFRWAEDWSERNFLESSHLAFCRRTGQKQEPAFGSCDVRTRPEALGRLISSFVAERISAGVEASDIRIAKFQPAHCR